ncbi:MAG: hypothetical protein IPN92_07985 [Chromatiaceae bacterium]|nr:hypothetical protein [Chromatiaceae bacterium]
MKNAIQASLIPLVMLVGLGGTAVSAQPSPVSTIPDPSVAPTLDERELEQAIREGETAGVNRAEWVIAPAPGTAPAQPAAPLYAPVPTEMAVAAPAPGGASSVPYISGGVGYDERARMEAAKSQYNLRLLFAVSGSGSYLSAVKVRVQDPRGATLLDATSNGPWFYAQLPPGPYVLTLDNQGQIQTRHIRITPQGATVENIYWAGPLSALPEAGTSDWGIQSAPGQASAAIPPMRPLMSRGGIPYLSGGGDPEEKARLEASQEPYNLRLVFTVTGADHKPLAIGVRVQEASSHRTLLEAEATGPLFFAKVPQGEYLVTLDYGGTKHQRTMKVPGYGAATASFQWTH